MRGHETIFVAHKNHKIAHNSVISNHSRTPLSYEDVVQQHSFCSTAVVQGGKSRGGRLALPKKKKKIDHLQRLGDYVLGVFVTY